MATPEKPKSLIAVWKVKDYADGWVYFRTYEEAKKLSDEMDGAAIRYQLIGKKGNILVDRSVKEIPLK